MIRFFLNEIIFLIVITFHLGLWSGSAGRSNVTSLAIYNNIWRPQEINSLLLRKNELHFGSDRDNDIYFPYKVSSPVDLDHGVFFFDHRGFCYKNLSQTPSPYRLRFYGKSDLNVLGLADVVLICPFGYSNDSEISFSVDFGYRRESKGYSFHLHIHKKE